MRTGTSSGSCRAAASAGPPVQSSHNGDQTIPSVDPWMAIRGSSSRKCHRSGNAIDRTIRGTPRSRSMVSRPLSRVVAGHRFPAGAMRAAGTAGSTYIVPELEAPCDSMPGNPPPFTSSSVWRSGRRSERTPGACAWPTDHHFGQPVVRRRRIDGTTRSAVRKDSGLALNIAISPGVRTSPRLRWIVEYPSKVGTSSTVAAPQTTTSAIPRARRRRQSTNQISQPAMSIGKNSK